MITFHCVECQIELATIKNGVRAVEMAIHGPLAIYAADLLECPGCNKKQLRFSSPYMQGSITELNTEIERVKQETEIFPIFFNKREKEEYEARNRSS